MVLWQRAAQSHEESRACGHAYAPAREKRHLTQLTSVWTQTKKQATRQSFFLHQQKMQVVRPPRCSWSHEHPVQVSWGIRQPPRSWRYGTSHRLRVHSAIGV